MSMLEWCWITLIFVAIRRKLSSALLDTSADQQEYFGAR